MKRTFLILLTLSLVVGACSAATPTSTTAGPAPSTTAAPAPTTTEAAAPVATTTTTTTTEPVVDGPVSPAPTADVTVPGQPIALSPTHYVVNVESDDVLNGRYGAGPGNGVNAELDPGYGTVRAKGTTTELDSGAIWANVAYSANTQLVNTPDAYGYGWVNSHFIAPIEGWVPAGGACDLGAGIGPIVGDAASTADEVYDVIAVDMGDCVRIIMTLGENAGGAHLGATLPDLGASVISGQRIRVELPVDSVLPYATDVFAPDASAVVAVNSGGGFWLDIAKPGVASVRGLVSSGQIIIDLAKGDVDAIFVRDGNLIGLPPSGPSDEFTFIGYGRPFEATLSLSVVDSGGVVYYPSYVHGSAVILGGAAVMTNGWMEAWGMYEFTVDDLPSGTYTVTVADDGAVESGFPVSSFGITVP